MDKTPYKEKEETLNVTISEDSMIFVELMIAVVFGAFIGFLIGRYNR